jgi:hypothetical protein|tara:strand:- start:823 stop:963 length:141 start_codon:yes stop_codon:yes gene_type:complete
MVMFGLFVGLCLMWVPTATIAFITAGVIIIFFLFTLSPPFDTFTST